MSKKNKKMTKSEEIEYNILLFIEDYKDQFSYVPDYRYLRTFAFQMHELFNKLDEQETSKGKVQK